MLFNFPILGLARGTVLMPLLLTPLAWSQLPTPPRRVPTSMGQTTSKVPAPKLPVSQLPAAQLSAAKPTQAQSSPGLQSTSPGATRSYHARVEFVDNQLRIVAENSSLDQILREIAHLTGMKITGGLNDERVYGNYGPDTAQVVLNELLEGTGTNMVLLETQQHALAELVLTPRNGGVTPPSPNALREEEGDEENVPPGLAGRRRDLPFSGRERRPEGDSGANGQFSGPSGAGPSGAGPSGAGPSGAGQSGAGWQVPIAPTTDETVEMPDATQPSPNGVRTPREMSEEFLKQQHPQQTETPPPQ